MSNTYTIYMHITPSGKRYVGQTCQDLRRRWRNGNGYVRNTYFYRAIEKYGWDNIRHEVIQTGLTLTEANKIEEELIAKYNTSDPLYGYNISGGADGKNRVSERTRKLLSERKKGTFVGKDNPNYGRKHTEAERRLMSEKTKGKFIGEKSPLWGKHPSPETRLKMSIARKNSPKVQEKILELNRSKAKRVLCVETGVLYYSVREAGRQTGFSQGNISSVCRGVYEQAYGFHWKYV